MWYWNPVDCNEALPGTHDLSGCTVINNDDHPFKTEELPEGKEWNSDVNNQPVLSDIPTPTEIELVMQAEATRATLRTISDAEIEWRQDAIDEGIATEEEAASLAEWKKYRVLLMRVDTADPKWPTPPVTQAS